MNKGMVNYVKGFIVKGQYDKQTEGFELVNKMIIGGKYK